MSSGTPMKARLAAGETLFGTFLTLGSPLAAESLGLAGFDWLLVDLEHGGGHESQLLGQLLGATAAGVHALVRVESDVRGRTARALDLGVEGVMCPQVNSSAAAEAWASTLHYGPAGSRGIAFFHRGARFGTDPEPVERARERVLGIAQIESPEAVEAVEEIAAVDGIDVLLWVRATCRIRWGVSASSTTRRSARRSSASSRRRTMRARPRGSSSPRPTRSRPRSRTAFA
jgi:2-keto-3-deoxy-L-rhamnonate aldolase RhmA